MKRVPAKVLNDKVELERRVKSMQPTLEFPAVLHGRELNTVVKDWNTAKVRGLIVSPVHYTASASNLGMNILYQLVNKREEFLMERSFLPERKLRKHLINHNLPIMYSYETYTPAINFDYIGFSSFFENQFPNIVHMLHYSGIPVYSEDRDESYPLIVLGGISAYTSSIVEPFIDAICIGDGELQLQQIMEKIQYHKENKTTKKELLLSLTEIPGVYIPAFYEEIPRKNKPYLEYKGVKQEYKGVVPEVVTKAVVDIDKIEPLYNSTMPLTDNNMVGFGNFEVQRGCLAGCRFCQAGWSHRPYRERSMTTIQEYMCKAPQFLGTQTITPYGLNVTSYSKINDLLTFMTKELNKTITASTQRIDTFDKDVSEALVANNCRGATFAIESGSERMRDVISKEIGTNEDILRTLKTVVDQRYVRLKLYMISHLPFETAEDRLEIIKLLKEFIAYRDKVYENMTVTVSFTKFAPKAFTPLQWAPIVLGNDTMYDDTITELKRLGLQFQKSINNINHAFQIFVSRSDRRMAKMLEEMAIDMEWLFDAGLIEKNKDFFEKLDDWFNRELGFSFYELGEEIPLDIVLPWDCLSTGVSKEFLKEEYLKAKSYTSTPNCMEKCVGCMACFNKDITKQIDVVMYKDLDKGSTKEQLIEAIKEKSKDLIQTKILVEFKLKHKARYTPTTKIKAILKSAFRLANIGTIKDSVDTLTDAIQFDSFIDGYNLALLRSSDIIRTITPKQLEVIKERTKEFMDIINVKLFKDSDVGGLHQQYEYILYHTILRVSDTDKALQALNGDGLTVGVKQRTRDTKVRGRVTSKTVTNTIYKVRAKKIGEGIVEVWLAVDKAVSPYDALRALLKLKDRKSLFNFPLEREIVFKAPSKPSIIIPKCKCGRMIEQTPFNKPIGKKCINCLTE